MLQSATCTYGRPRKGARDVSLERCAYLIKQIKLENRPREQKSSSHAPGQANAFTIRRRADRWNRERDKGESQSQSEEDNNYSTSSCRRARASGALIIFPPESLLWKCCAWERKSGRGWAGSLLHSHARAAFRNNEGSWQGEEKEKICPGSEDDLWPRQQWRRHNLNFRYFVIMLRLPNSILRPSLALTPIVRVECEWEWMEAQSKNCTPCFARRLVAPQMCFWRN
jgi:hypothetical protein